MEKQLVRLIKWIDFPNLVFGFLGFCALCIPASAQTLEQFFDDTVLQEIRLDVNPKDWALIQANPRSDNYYAANFKWRGIEVDNVAIRHRGNSTRNGTKPGLRVDFNRFQPNQTFLGLAVVGLDNNAQDASMIKERVVMETFTRLGLPAPRETSARVYVNDEYYGVYTIIEGIEKEFAQYKFGEDGYIFESQGPMNYRFEYLGSDPTMYVPVYFDPKNHQSDPGSDQLVAMIRTMNQSTDAQFASAMAPYMDLSLAMKHLATEDFMGETDGILSAMNNFYLYRYLNKMWQFIPKDKDLTFGGDPLNQNRPQTPLLQHANENILIRRALAVPAARDAYFKTIANAAQFTGAGNWMESEITRMYNQVRDAALADPKKQCQVGGIIGGCTNDRFESEIAADLQFARERGNYALAASASLSGQRLYAFVDRGGVSITRASSAANISVGYGTVDPDNGNSTPAGVEIFTYRQNGIVVTETSVPASAAIQHGLIYGEISGNAKTGIALANPGTTPASISFTYTGADGKSMGSGTFNLAAGAQMARFLDEAPFNLAAGSRVGFTFDASSPVYIIALRGLANERSEFILSTLPVADSTAIQGSIVIPHFADGGGWSTQAILLNPSSQAMQGTLQFVDQKTQQTAASTPYSIAPGSFFRFQTAGAGSDVQVGFVRIVPGSNTGTPAGFGIFSFRKDGITVSEASMTATAGTTAYRMYVENSDTIQTGIAIANPSSNPATVTLEATTLDGTTAGLSGTLTIPGNGQTAQFLSQIPGFEKIGTFQGVLRITTTGATGVAVSGLRGRFNERNDFLIASLPSADENISPGRNRVVFPHYVEGAGYTTQFILFSGAKSTAASGTIRLYNQSGILITTW